MKLENYKRDDITDALEIKKLILHQLEQIEMNVWTDDIDTAIQRTVDMHLMFVNHTRMQSSKRIENICNVLKMHNIGVQIINSKHKKAD